MEDGGDFKRRGAELGWVSEGLATESDQGGDEVARQTEDLRCGEWRVRWGKTYVAGIHAG
jgi:hypothetical protein